MNTAAAFLRDVFPTRTYQAAAVFAALVAAALCFVPLFNLLGYESSALFGVTGGVLATGLTLHACRAGLVAAPLDPERGRSPLRDFGTLFARHLALLVAPAALLALNALRVRNCDLATGVAFFVVIAPASVLLGQLSAWVGLAIAPCRRWLHRLIGFGLPAANALWLGLLLALEPPIVGFQWWIGYFGGSIYDEAMVVPTSLLWYRALNLVMVAAVLVALEALWRRRLSSAGTSAHGARPTRGLWAVVAALTFVFAVGFGLRKHAGIDIDRGFITDELGGRYETEHFVIHYPLREPFLEQIVDIAEDHEFRYARLASFFASDPVSYRGRKVRSFIYPDRDEKGRLMGARNTMIAKLWLHEMHILWRGYGDNMLTHELAHIFTEPFGRGPLRLSTRFGIGVNMGLVEGIATAADWPVRELSPHESSAAMRTLGLAPDIRRLVGASGFWTQASGRAYTLMGSFVRYLIDTHGIERFKQAYPAGDFEAAYGRTSSQLVADWEAFLDTLTLGDDQLEMARYLYDRPGIFGKVCARTIADLRRQASEAAVMGDVLGAREIFERIIGFDPANNAYHLEYARTLDNARDPVAALTVLDALLDRELSPVERAEVHALQGDLLWQQQQFAAAAAAYDRCLETKVPTDLERNLRIKRRSVTDDALARSHAFEYLLGRSTVDVRLYFPMAWHAEQPDHPVARYFVARRLWAARLWDQALPYLESLEGRMDSELLDAEVLRMLGQSQYFVGRLEDAADAMSALARSDSSRYREEARQWLERIEWKHRNSEPARGR